MTKEDVMKIEKDLDISLPECYKEAVLNYPFEQDSGKFEWSLGDCAESVIRWTKEYRKGYACNPPWPATLICIGTEGDGCPIVLNLESEKVLKIYKGNPNKPPMEKYDSFTNFMDVLRKDWENIDEWE